MQAPYILYDNILTKGSISASDATSLATINNVIDMRTHTYWAPPHGERYYYINLDTGATLQTADAFGLCGFSDISSVSVFTSTDATAWSVICQSVITTSDNIILSTFASTAAKYWRIRLTATSTAVAPSAAIVYLGTKLDFPKCPSIGTAPIEESIKVVSNHSQSGILLGNVVKYHPQQASLNFDWLSATFFRDSTGGAANLGAFWKDHGRYLRPFFISFAQDTYPEHKYFARLSEDQTMATPLQDSTLVQNFRMKIVSCLESST